MQNQEKYNRKIIFTKEESENVIYVVKKGKE